MPKYYECRCGHVITVTEPCPCAGCEVCNTVPTRNGNPPQSIRPHRWRVIRVETDDGIKTVTRCQWCGILKRDTE